MITPSSISIKENGTIGACSIHRKEGIENFRLAIKAKQVPTVARHPQKLATKMQSRRATILKNGAR
ncbi:hypothetical protein OUZ56_020724 [Daphnia magna]|uniref:Uncharacterized protein n=1 Tax=Daphnia magna TaxID=35525 RepID=A0ABQ9ZGC7_9CRUS|nr:hypothetical protein OUZ56_020724 [Daphnia magna]